MATWVMEIATSREVDLTSDSGTATMKFVGYGSFDNDVMETAFAAEVPTVFPTTFRVLIFKSSNVRHVGGLFWECDAKYQTWALEDIGALTPATPGGDPGNSPDNPGDAPGDPLPGAMSYSINISAVTEHITQSYETRHKTNRFGGPNEDAPDCQRAIGVTADGEIKGCDIVSPRMEMSVTVLSGEANLNYYGTLYKLVGKCNVAAWYGFAANEVKFMGADIQSHDRAKIQVTFKFEMQPNETNIEICDSLTLADKKGWDYIWVAYEPKVENERPIMVPYAAYVERVVKYVNFDLLGIGH